MVLGNVRFFNGASASIFIDYNPRSGPVVFVTVANLLLTVRTAALYNNKRWGKSPPTDFLLMVPLTESSILSLHRIGTLVD